MGSVAKSKGARVTILLLALPVLACFTMAFGFVNSLTLFCILRFLQGLCFMFCSPTCFVCFHSKFPLTQLCPICPGASYAAVQTTTYAVSSDWIPEKRDLAVGLLEVASLSSSPSPSPSPSRIAISFQWPPPPSLLFPSPFASLDVLWRRLGHWPSPRRLDL